MKHLFLFFYTTVTLLLYLVSVPVLLLLSFRKKYRHAIPARFFLWRNPPMKEGGIWFHSCSFGEAKALKPIIDALPQSTLRMTTTTHTGKSVIDGYTTQSRYLPFEPLLWGWIRPHKALVVMEAEFWYLLFVLAQKRGAKTLLINARMSERSFPNYLRFRWFYQKIFAHIDEIYAQTETDKTRLEMLGATEVHVIGNIKLSDLPKPGRTLQKPEGLILCAASTHEGEESLILDAFKVLKTQREDARLIIVPRHPERFKEVGRILDRFASKARMQWERFSEDERLESDIILVDRMGELVNFYAISDLVILGGSFIPVGGHNAAEAAQFGCRIISGPHYFNQKEIFEAIEGITVVEPYNLSRRIEQYAQIKPAKLKYRCDLSPILHSLKSVDPWYAQQEDMV